MKRKLRQRKWAGLLPTSGEVLGGLARLIDWKPKQSARERTWRKFCGGEHIHEQTRRDIVEELLAAVIHKGTGSPSDRDAQGYKPLIESLTPLVMIHVTWWDDICARLKAALPMEPTTFTTTAALRLVSVELAMRFGSALLQKGVPLDLPPSTAKPIQGIGMLLLPQVLRQVLKKAHITREALADALGVSSEAVDQWLKPGAIIRPALLDDIAELVSEKQGVEPAALGMQLRVTREVSRVLIPLSRIVGAEALSQLVVGLIQLTAVCRGALEAHLAGIDEKARGSSLSLLILTGGECLLAPMLREAMMAQAPDESWRGAIATPLSKWGSFLGSVFTSQLGLSRLQRFCEEQGFPWSEGDAQPYRQLVLLPHKDLPPPLSELAALPRAEAHKICTVIVWQHFRRLNEQCLTESLKEYGVLAECCAVMSTAVEGELKPLVEKLRWLCVAMYILGCMEKGQELLKQERYSEAGPWGERIVKLVRSLPELPSDAAPDLQPILDFLRLMRRAQVACDAETPFKASPQDFAFLDEMRRQRAAAG